MTPAQQKAKELVDKFKPLVTTWDCYWDLPRNPDDITVDAKQCALICADEMLSLGGLVGSNLSDSFYIYWHEVKQAIQEL